MCFFNIKYLANKYSKVSRIYIHAYICIYALVLYILAFLLSLQFRKVNDIQDKDILKLF